MSELQGEPRLGPARISNPDEGPTFEQVSKVKLTLNSKQDTQFEISVVEGAEPDELERIRMLAIREHRALMAEFYGQ